MIQKPVFMIGELTVNGKLNIQNHAAFNSYEEAVQTAQDWMKSNAKLEKVFVFASIASVDRAARPIEVNAIRMEPEAPTAEHHQV